MASAIDKKTLKKRVDEIMKISTVPAILKSVLDVVEKEESCVGDLESVIEHDQAIAARVLGISNSVYYGFSGRISSIHQAILVLGFEMVKGVAVSTAVFRGMQDPGSREVVRLWTHSFGTGRAASIIAAKTGLAGKEPAFLAGLLHDIGKPILYQLIGSEYIEVCTGMGQGSQRAEEVRFGAAHPEVGSWFAEKCKLPQECVKAINFHHNPEMCLTPEGKTTSCLTCIVYLADVIESEGVKAEVQLSDHHEKIIECLGIDETKLNGIRQEFASMREEIGRYYKG